MAKVIEDQFHVAASALIKVKYIPSADARQRSMGLSYVKAETKDLISEIAAHSRAAYETGRSEVIQAITYTLSDGSIVNKFIEDIDLREYL